jgi:type II secretory pathway pseudopilin PulG
VTRRRDDGFTLIEALIALLVMTIAVVTLAGAMATMIKMTREHRGHAVAETGARSFAQAVEATAQAPALLKVTASPSDTKIFVNDASALPAAGSSSTYLLLDREVLVLEKVTDRASGELQVARGAGGSTAITHTVSATLKPAVVPLLVCPSKVVLTPFSAAYKLTPGAKAEIIDVSYQKDDGTFADTSGSCLTDYSKKKSCATGALLMECASAVFRVSVRITTPDDTRFNGIGASTMVLVRQGSS